MNSASIDIAVLVNVFFTSSCRYHCLCADSPTGSMVSGNSPGSNPSGVLHLCCPLLHEYYPRVWAVYSEVVALYPDQFPEVRTIPDLLLACIWNHVSLCQLCCVLKCMCTQVYVHFQNHFCLDMYLADLLTTSTMSWRHQSRLSSQERT